MARRKFPTLAIILLVIALVWLFGNLGNVSWIPVIILIIAIGIIVNRLARK